MMKLITEVSHDLELVESKSKGTNIVGIFSSAEIKNNNDRRYKKSILEREVTKVNEKVKLIITILIKRISSSTWSILTYVPLVFSYFKRKFLKTCVLSTDKFFFILSY